MLFFAAAGIQLAFAQISPCANLLLSTRIGFLDASSDLCFFKLQTVTNVHVYVYIYIYRERERESLMRAVEGQPSAVALAKERERGAFVLVLNISGFEPTN